MTNLPPKYVLTKLERFGSGLHAYGWCHDESVYIGQPPFYMDDHGHSYDSQGRQLRTAGKLRHNERILAVYIDRHQKWFGIDATGTNTLEPPPEELLEQIFDRMTDYPDD
jgi:hypothetical protein